MTFTLLKEQKNSIHIGIKFQFHYFVNIYTTFIITKDDNSDLEKICQTCLPLMDHDSLRTTDIRKRTLKIDRRKSAYSSWIRCNDHDCKTTWSDSSIASIKNHWKIINYLYFLLYINYLIININIIVRICDSNQYCNFHIYLHQWLHYLFISSILTDKFLPW